MTNATDLRPTAPATLRYWWDGGYTWDDYLGREVVEQRELWTGVYAKTSVPDWASRSLAKMDRSWHLLVIAEDWCGDAANLVPVFARLAESAPHVELRVVKRDEHPDLMDLYLTSGTRSIPIVVVLDERFRPIGRWGPRPAELQEWVLREKRAGKRPNSEIYKDTRRWYARDGGGTTLREVLEVMAHTV